MSLPSYDDLLRQLDEARKESAYYRRIAQVAGRARLQETEKLSLLVRARRKAEQRLEKARDELEKRVKERTDELSHANAELRAEMEENKRLELKLRHSEKMEAIGTLAGVVAHDLNNILSGVVSYPELLLLDIPENSEFREPLNTIYHSGLKATAVVQDLLTLARRGVSIKAPLQLNRIISEYLESPEYHKLQEYHPNVQIQLRLQPDLYPIVGSHVHLSKTVMNLVSNAAEAMQYGGNITLSTENKIIGKTGPGCRQTHRHAVLRITDSGHGISQQDIRRIFEPFYTRKVMGRSGTGLGMAVVKGTVEDHSGEIDVRSREGEGTTFTLYFPATREAIPKTPLAMDLEQYMGSGESVLVVDDVFEQREIATRMLKRLGYRAEAVSSGEEAVEYIRQYSADLVMLDMILEGGIDGLDTYRELLAIMPGQKAMIVSGFSETTRVKEAQALGATTYVRKPYSIETLARATRDELDGLTASQRQAQLK